MGQEIKEYQFTEKNSVEFKRRLKEETALLKEWFEHDQFESPEPASIGLEIESWLIDKDCSPFPGNEQFLALANSPLLVHELSKFNFEINTRPIQLSGTCFNSVESHLKALWSKCLKIGDQMGVAPLLIGTLPTLHNEMLIPKNMTESARYKSLNKQIFHMRKGKPLTVNINGAENFNIVKSDIMLEAASTSIQIHLEVKPCESSRYYNASLLASAMTVAVAANSPYLYGYELWDETRIAIFEKAVQIPNYIKILNEDVNRVTFGTGYTQESVLDSFLENLDIFSPLVPSLFDGDDPLSHLKFHNGTIWRWNRPIVGSSPGKAPHLRIEHRVMASGPSITDIIANMVFYLGLTHYFASLETPPESQLPFEHCKNNFYTCAKNGLNSNIQWFQQQIGIRELLTDQLIPQAKQTLINKGVDKDEVGYYLDEVISSRVLSGQNGANWQKCFVKKYGKDFQGLTDKYLENQTKGDPIYKWKI